MSAQISWTMTDDTALQVAYHIGSHAYAVRNQFPDMASTAYRLAAQAAALAGESTVAQGYYNAAALLSPRTARA